MSGKRLKVVLYNPQAVFFTMPLALRSSRAGEGLTGKARPAMASMAAS